MVFRDSVILAAVAGYMAGLIGSSNSPISGLGILVVVVASLVLVLVHGRSWDPAQAWGLGAYALFATAIVFGFWAGTASSASAVKNLAPSASRSARNVPTADRPSWVSQVTIR